MVKYMLLNNIKHDFKARCKEENFSEKRVGEATGTSGAYLSRLINNPEKIVNKIYLAAMEQLGYDVRLVYEKRNPGREDT